MSAQYGGERPPSELARAALTYAQRWNLRLIPLLVARKEPFARAVPHGYLDASCAPETVEGWWARAPRANVGIACAPSALVVIDIDPRNGGDETLGQWTSRLGELPETWRALTPGGGVHYYFRYPQQDYLHDLGPGVDIKHRGYVVAPPSIHPNGGRYRWDLGAHPMEAPLADVPIAWLAQMRRAGEGDSAPRPASSGLDAAESFLGAAFEALGWLGARLTDGRRCARCPWAALHTDGRGRGRDSSTVLFSPVIGTSLGGFHCSHAHCAGRRVVDVVQELPAEAVEAASRAYPKAYQVVVRRLAVAQRSTR
jgi:hypothetical protein